MAAKKQTQQLARQLFKLSFENGQITAERVAGVLGYVEKIQPPQIVAVLKAYQRLIASELGRGRFEFRARDDGSAVVGEPLRGVRGERSGGAPFVGRDAELAQVVSADYFGVVRPRGR